MSGQVPRAFDQTGGGTERVALECVREATPQALQVLGCVLERWNGLTDTQRARVYALVEQLHQATVIRGAGRAMPRGAR